MYPNNIMEVFASPKNLVKLLKRDLQFNQYCIEERLKKGDTLTLDTKNEFFYMLESGYLKETYTDILNIQFHLIVKPPHFPIFATTEEEMPESVSLTALTDVRWWKIDFQFFKKVLYAEDPRSYVVLHNLLFVKSRLYELVVKDRMEAADRIYYTLLQLLDISLVAGKNRAEFPRFLDYTLLAELASTSRSYTVMLLGELRDKGILVTNKKPWKLEDIAALQALLFKEK
ncbi:Crp/Fnr family transcriptional regulator [Listeria booriae]|uniref:Crp/Fnr family transcriptional regulator n=1 Tax=Listeria booriae TaxID=1552123 RepID=A0A7X0XY55_9LIST|nr:Crp/Fnr family transcriptional regulator [Listeria booriae]MBC1793506.1 Crp/Fnr family transcriptional regulator [Listeria booriae]MBC2172804.1 Crp/Fnr family transcriptional regulator [Listeria booriae]